MPRHPSHDIEPYSQQCRRCGMLHEEMLDYDIECADAAAADMPAPAAGMLHGLRGGLHDGEWRTRHLVIEGLAALAARKRRSMERYERAQHADVTKPDASIPPAIVQAAARKLREGGHLIGEVLGQVLADLRAAGWVVEADLLPGKIVCTPNSPGYLFLSWPAEMQPPFFQGPTGNHTLAPWSVKLTPHTTRDGCWPPDGTPDGSIHILVQRFHDLIVTERAMWHAENSHWTRWLDSRPTGDFAACCLATYVGPEPVVVTPYPGLPKVVPHPDLERRLVRPEMRPRPADWRPTLTLRDADQAVMILPPKGSACVPLGYQASINESTNRQLMEAALDSMWFALEHERITGKPPSVPTPPAVGTPIGWPSPL